MSNIELLKEAAFNYWLALNHCEGAIVSGFPLSLVAAIIAIRQEAERNLLEAACQYFDDVYDGDTE